MLSESYVVELHRQYDGTALRDAMQRAVAILRQQGVLVDELELPPEFMQITPWHTVIMDGEGRASFLGDYVSSKDKLDRHLVGHVENESGRTKAQQLAAYDGMTTLRSTFDDIAKDYAGIITPSAPDEAPIGLEWTGSPAFCGMWTMLHTPVINLPGFSGANGRLKNDRMKHFAERVTAFRTAHRIVSCGATLPRPTSSPCCLSCSKALRRARRLDFSVVDDTVCMYKQ